MKQRTEKEIVEFCRELWKDDRYPGSIALSDFECSVTGLNTDCVRVTVNQMYEAPTLNLSVFKKFATFFETENINDDDKFSNGGCETCDYGSQYGFTLSVRP